jgi:hypothetical protein
MLLTVSLADVTVIYASIREKHANNKKISDFEWEDTESQDSEDAF